MRPSPRPDPTVQNATAPLADLAPRSTPELIEAFAAGPERLRLAIAGLSEDELQARPRGPGSWSIQEIVLHTADSELQGTYRIKKTLAEPAALWPVYDQDRWTSRFGHQTGGPAAREDAFALLALLRRQTLPLFRGATAEEWARHGIHPEMGPMTLRNLLEMYAEHIERHIGQILDIRRRIGSPSEMLPLLSR
jgi:uncharacterized damage-inducible protein DinB